MNSKAGREFTSTAHQSLSSDIFTKKMCIRSWMKAGVRNIPADWHEAVLSLTVWFPAAASDAVVSTIEVEQEEWVDDSALGELNTLLVVLL